ncbi:MAG: hypothetical protein KC729_03945, partial [Candidatus Eisenbacteria bacterium]|nr:hypothetical protein [Candidatus Eisenbacteria bacterium]
MPALALRLGSLLIGCASVACAAALLANAASTADAQTMVGVSAGPAFVDLQGREREEPLKYEVGAQV